MSRLLFPCFPREPVLKWVFSIPMLVFLLCITCECILKQYKCLLLNVSFKPGAIGTTYMISRLKPLYFPISATLVLCLSEKNSKWEYHFQMLQFGICCVSVTDVWIYRHVYRYTYGWNSVFI